MKLLTSLTIAIGLACSPAGAQLTNTAPVAAQSNAAQNNTVHQAQRDAFVSDLLRKMTTDEKIGQLRLISVGTNNPKHVIREMIRDGQVGAVFNTVTRQDIRAMQDQVMELSRLKIALFFAYDVVHSHRTIFPIALGLASSWDMNNIAKSARVSAYEPTEDGLNMTWALIVDITRDPRWGRVSEGFGEDTWLTSQIARVVVKAFQDEAPTDIH